jgi:hypothetical protein
VGGRGALYCKSMRCAWVISVSGARFSVWLRFVGRLITRAKNKMSNCVRINEGYLDLNLVYDKINSSAKSLPTIRSIRSCSLSCGQVQWTLSRADITGG